jgi:hypothetical protein
MVMDIRRTERLVLAGIGRPRSELGHERRGKGDTGRRLNCLDNLVDVAARHGRRAGWATRRRWEGAEGGGLGGVERWIRRGGVRSRQAQQWADPRHGRSTATLVLRIPFDLR